jgi:hypothetical protein
LLARLAGWRARLWCDVRWTPRRLRAARGRALRDVVLRLSTAACAAAVACLGAGVVKPGKRRYHGAVAERGYALFITLPSCSTPLIPGAIEESAAPSVAALPQATAAKWAQLNHPHSPT